MMKDRVFLVLFTSAVLLQGCGSSSSVPVISSGEIPYQTSSDGRPQAPKCKGQVIVGQHAEVTEHIPRQGASLCVPSFRGFGGFLGFPSVRPAPEPVKLIVTVPQLGMLAAQHKPIFNLEWLPGAQFRFGKTAPPGGISGWTMTPGKTYTGSAVIYFKGGHENVGPCYSIATRGKYGGVFYNLGTLMEKQGGSFIVWDLSISDGKAANRRC